MKAIFSESSELLLSILLGLFGGSVCGIVILSFNSLIGRSGTTGSEYVGAWDWGIIGIGIMYGSFFGILAAPLGYIIFIRKIGLRKAIFPAAAGTILGGFFGAFYGPSEALYYGCLGFFSALFGLWLTTLVIKRHKR